jgi:hypothetical protein
VNNADIAELSHWIMARGGGGGRSISIPIKESSIPNIIEKLKVFKTITYVS